jgi:hypothetical protein
VLSFITCSTILALCIKMLLAAHDLSRIFVYTRNVGRFSFSLAACFWGGASSALYE